MKSRLHDRSGGNIESFKNSKFGEAKSKFSKFIVSQAKYKTAWVLSSLAFQSLFFLPIPIILTFYYGAPKYLLIITLNFFFANIIAGMSGVGVRAIMYLLAASIVAQLLLLSVFV